MLCTNVDSAAPPLTLVVSNWPYHFSVVVSFACGSDCHVELRIRYAADIEGNNQRAFVNFEDFVTFLPPSDTIFRTLLDGLGGSLVEQNLH